MYIQAHRSISDFMQKSFQWQSQIQLSTAGFSSIQGYQVWYRVLPNIYSKKGPKKCPRKVFQKSVSKSIQKMAQKCFLNSQHFFESPIPEEVICKYYGRGVSLNNSSTNYRPPSLLISPFLAYFHNMYHPEFKIILFSKVIHRENEAHAR